MKPTKDQSAVKLVNYADGIAAFLADGGEVGRLRLSFISVSDPYYPYFRLEVLNVADENIAFSSDC